MFKVRTPLNHIINYLEMALEGPLDDDTRESLVRSHAASRTLVHVINDLLDLTRTETGQQFFLQDPMDLGGTIEEAASIHRLEAQRAGVAFEIIENPTGTPQTLLGDRGKIRQIIANVTGNAVKHTKEGKVTIEWGELSKELDDPAETSVDTIKIGIAIRDTGAGIPEEQLEEMFRIFEQVEKEDDKAEAAPTSGAYLGLGLAVVARIVSQLGGQLRVESKVGHGSKFTFVLHFRLPGPDDLSRRGSTSFSDKPRRESREMTAEAIAGHRPTESRVHRTNSKGSLASKRTGSSLRSLKQASKGSRQSEIDSLVEAISSHPGSHSHAEQGMLTSPKQPKKAGEVNIEDSRTPLRSIKVEEGDVVETSPRIGDSDTDFSQPGLGRHRTSHAGVGNLTFGTLSQTPFHSRNRSNSSPRASTSSPVQQTSLFDPPDRSPVTVKSTTPKMKPLRIMIVEDDAINRAILLKKLVREFSHEVKQTVHGEEAVRLYQEDRRFDLILMDLQLVAL